MEILNIIILSCAAVSAFVSIARMISSTVASKKEVTLTRKDTGESVTITRHYNKQESSQLRDLIKQL